MIKLYKIIYIYKTNTKSCINIGSLRGLSIYFRKEKGNILEILCKMNAAKLLYKYTKTIKDI